MAPIFLVLGLLLLPGCATFVPVGAIYTQGKMAVQADGGGGSKTGKACMKSILALVTTGDASVEAAMAAGGISKVSTINYEVENILGVIGTYCTVVRGE